VALFLFLPLVSFTFMVPSILKVCQALAVLATFGGFVYTLLSLWGAVRFLWQPEILPPVELPAVSILKPLKGLDPEMLASLRSHCIQDYSNYEIVFGVSEAGDAAIDAVENLKSDFPSLAIKLVVCEKRLGANTKVSTLAQMAPHASHEYFVVNDSDIQVSPDYLRRVISPLASANVGLVTCLYRGVPAATLGSWLESLGILEFASGVLPKEMISFRSLVLHDRQRIDTIEPSVMKRHPGTIDTNRSFAANLRRR